MDDFQGDIAQALNASRSQAQCFTVAAPRTLTMRTREIGAYSNSNSNSTWKRQLQLSAMLRLLARHAQTE